MVELHTVADRPREELARPYDPTSAPEELLRRSDAAMHAEKSEPHGRGGTGGLNAPAAHGRHLPL